MSIDRALIVHRPWAQMIVGGDKKWELRKRMCHIRGRIGIIEAGTSTIIGEADFVDCIGVGGDLSRYFSLHRVPDSELRRYSIEYAWCFENAVKYWEPKPYVHPKGAQVWVKLVQPMGRVKGE